MEQNVHTPEAYDYRQYDRVWQRVAPTLEPYPGQPAEARPAAADAPVRTAPEPAVRTPVQTAASQSPASAALAPRGESTLPGAFPNPCCMGTAASEMLEVLTGFIEEELEDCRRFSALSRQGPGWAKRQLRDIAAEEREHARRLMAVHYLITGTCYRPALEQPVSRPGRWCPALRERYHAEACGGFNYARAAEGTTDPCLSRLLEDLSADEYRHAADLLAMLEKSLQTQP